MGPEEREEMNDDSLKYQVIVKEEELSCSSSVNSSQSGWNPCKRGATSAIIYPSEFCRPTTINKSFGISRLTRNLEYRDWMDPRNPQVVSERTHSNSYKTYYQYTYKDINDHIDLK